ncbi:adenylate/guanylate cyclase domain-containing protein [Rhizobium hidalgonense]|uniref:Adenylate/guanylate cyclase domain-containing protein n=1 Tax=Rhizobium hidalgonense TaxID=1538159 RepID=A0A2A6KJH2_9HYPH|nr:adenylate/guanylate cyclase domain-containing protein [Rhizobium hidalgonense]EJC75874.1 family 3 adenylate cyclase [Rhizobium leguminosarum bv. trifolii WSM2012]MDR9777452.1 adenylate/guanylate cyclase domain-containing protein [Rhizobium hidalgonense]MDR9806086.1 adenylate/guanylate cyclase domain-containing protein [Rhizobium hidalgonense]MDR9811597.1 adenylate/guanylate cyclase domain-containing protein [Rhizobium hidalgonense]MDR9823757.1 adenylate/guanylate cyclase domain-containing p
MDYSDVSTIAAWITEQGLTGASESELMTGFCAACRKAGLRLDRGMALMDTLHPVHEGRAFRWDSVEEIETEFEYGPSGVGEAAESWKRSSFYYLWSGNEREVRRRIGFGDPIDFSMLDTIAAAGHTDYIAMMHRFAEAGTIGEMDCFFSNFSTKHPEGFSDHDLAILRKLVPVLGLAIKCIALGRIARTIAEVYLGEDAARQVMEGKISRGKSERISAALWFSDLLNYTKISDRVPPEEIIPLLNDYSEVVISAIHEAGGNVLKLIGDGVLAIFKGEVPAETCRAALQAQSLLREKLAKLNAEREADNRPTTDVYIGLHIGDVFYGNIGSQDRLDFTVIGPAVNEVSRIASMCRSVDLNLLISSDFAAAIPEEQRAAIACVGRYALRGVQRAQELYTLDGARLNA